MKVLVLGSDFGTIDLVNEAHRQGDYVVCADYYDITSTKIASDERWNVSTLDVDEIEKRCRAEGVEAIVFGANDQNIEAGREICKRLGLPYYCKSDSAWILSRNKRVFKDYCKKIGAPVATDYFIAGDANTNEYSNIQFPVVVKAVDLAANVGFSYCDNATDLKKAINKVHKFSKNPTFIVERRLYGPEFVANYVLAEGKAVLNHFCSEHHQPGYPANLYSIINTTNWCLKQYIDELNDYVVQLFEESGFTDGVAWVECMRDLDGHFYLIEPGYRFCGEVTHQPYCYLSGFDSIKWMLDIAKGVRHKQTDLPEPLIPGIEGSAISYHLFGSQEGIVNKIEGVDFIESNIPNVVIDLPHREGYNMRLHKNMGVIRFPCKNRNDIVRNINMINDNFKVLDEDGNSLFIKYTNIRELLDQYDESLLM